ncbi:MAG: membrane dipeptidase, partial [Pseudomonadota bacterium]
TPEHAAAMEKLNAEFGTDFPSMSEARAREYRTARHELFNEFPPPRSTFEKYLEHLFHMLELVGVDHVGIGADWDGGGGVTGMIDVTALPRITAALVEAGYSEADIAKIWSGNLLRLMREVEAARTDTLKSPDVLN